MKQLSKSEVQQVSGGEDVGVGTIAIVVGPLPEPVAPASPSTWMQAPIKNQP
ncbi:MAG: hypothetical protein ACXWHZ_10625 [Usitatibacter sp.]